MIVPNLIFCNISYQPPSSKKIITQKKKLTRTLFSVDWHKVKMHAYEVHTKPCWGILFFKGTEVILGLMAMTPHIARSATSREETVREVFAP